MCGIAGLLAPDGAAVDGSTLVPAMLAHLAHRGPDDDGLWCDPGAGVWLGHRRLAVIDLSVEGHQPMASADGRYVVSYNGEIYNFRALRRELEGAGHRFRGHCDTEVLVEALARWGVHETLARCNGMFAMAVWDRHRRQLHLARDRLGEKPLYYGWSGGRLAFASELKALRPVPRLCTTVDCVALREYLRFGWVAAPRTIFRGVAKLPAGAVLTVPAPGAPSGRLNRYWSVAPAIDAGPDDRPEGELVDELQALALDAVRLRMVADVPLGAFLSGGVDSSLVVALMQASASRPVQTFTVGFHERAFDESHHAAAVAAHLGTEHHELVVGAPEARAVIPDLAGIYDEPFGDPSAIPTVLVSRLARRHVTVALSGDGGDELFAGYDRHRRAERNWRLTRRVPGPARRPLGSVLRRPSASAWDRVLGAAGRVPGLPQGRGRGWKAHRLAGLLDVESPDRLWEHLLTQWERPESVVLGSGGNGDGAVTDPAPHPRRPMGVTEEVMYRDLVEYLPDDILVKVDRASMSVSLEARVPLLDHRLVERAWRIPLDRKLTPAGGKVVLRRLLHRFVPPALVERPKMGFGVPVGDWVRGPLRDWAEDLLSTERLAADGFFAPAAVRHLWREHLDGRARDLPLWNLLMFQAWLDEERSR
jgi:asparagine synthase (glutamine-hydrolysing)